MLVAAPVVDVPEVEPVPNEELVLNGAVFAELKKVLPKVCAVLGANVGAVVPNVFPGGLLLLLVVNTEAWGLLNSPGTVFPKFEAVPKTGAPPNAGVFFWANKGFAKALVAPRVVVKIPGDGAALLVNKFVGAVEVKVFVPKLLVVPVPGTPKILPELLLEKTLELV